MTALNSAVLQYIERNSKIYLRVFRFIVPSILFVMFILGYFESFRWPFPGPRATHGILKGLFLLLTIILIIHSYIKTLLKSSTETVQLIQRYVGLKLLMVVFLLSYVVSALFSLAPSASLLNLWYPFISTALIFAFSEIKLKKSLVQITVIVSILLILVTFIFAFFSLMFRYSIDNIYYFIFLEQRALLLLSELRQTGKYVSLGPYIMLLPLSLSFLFDKKRNWSRSLLGFTVYIVGVLTAVISNNRIDVLVLAIQSFIFFFLFPKKTIVIFIICALPIIQFGLFTNEKYFGYSLTERIFRPKTERDLETIDIRFTYWTTAMYNFRNYPIFGTGPNTYNDVSIFPIRRYYIPRTSEYTLRLDQGIGIHNLFFERLADTGVFGFFSFVILLLYCFRKDVIAVLKFSDHNARAQYVLFSLSSWSWILYGITDNGYGAQGFVVFFFLRAILQQL